MFGIMVETIISSIVFCVASGEDPSCTPSKSRKDGLYHPSTPLSTVPSPGAASMNSMHDEYPPDSSPTWPRTPASPVSTFYKLIFYPKIIYQKSYLKNFTYFQIEKKPLVKLVMCIVDKANLLT